MAHLPPHASDENGDECSCWALGPLGRAEVLLLMLMIWAYYGLPCLLPLLSKPIWLFIQKQVKCGKIEK